MNTPSYYAIIPANVRYDKDLKPNEKLLYGEITCLANKQGYCFATNSYFAELYDVNKATVSRWISHLIEKGYIKSEIVLNGKSVDERRIYLTSFAEITPIDEKVNTPIDEKVNTPIDEKVNTPIDEKVKDNNTRENNINFNINSSAQPKNDTAPKQKSEYTQIIERYFDNFKHLYDNGQVMTEKPVVNFKQAGAMVKGLLKSISKESIFKVLDTAMNDMWIVSQGYPLAIILSATQVNKLLNAKPMQHYQQDTHVKKEVYTDEEYMVGMSDLDTIGF